MNRIKDRDMPEKLKPCPFCGSSEGVSIEPDINPHGKQDGYIVECQNIYCIFQPSGWAESKECAVKAWNERITN